MALEAEQLDECHWLYRHSMVLFLIQPLAGEMQTHDMRLRCLHCTLPVALAHPGRALRNFAFLVF